MSNVGQAVVVVNEDGITPPVDFGLGIHQIEYRAIDGDGRESFCSFSISIQGDYSY